MKTIQKITIIIFLILPKITFSNVTYFAKITSILKDTNIVISLAKVTNITDSSINIIALDSIRNKIDSNYVIDLNESFSNNLFTFKYKPKIGDSVIIFINSYFNSFASYNGESILLYKNDSIYIYPNAIKHGCYYNKYGTYRGYGKLFAYDYNDFKIGIYDYVKYEIKISRLIKKEKAIINEKNITIKQHGYKILEGNIPNINNKWLLDFKNKSKFHERLIDEILDNEITSTY